MSNTKTLANGAIYDMDKKRIVANPNGGTKAFTTANASEMQARRYELARERIREAVLAEVQSISDIPANTPADAYAFVVAKQTTALIDSDKPRFDDVRRLGELMDLVPQRGQDAETPADTIGALTDLLREVSAFASSLPAHVHVVDAEATDAGEG